jgi:5'-nucleotidase
VTIVHLNDVYEILPVEGGKSGGLARVATVIKQMKATRSPLVTTLRATYLSPSALGTAIVDGAPMAGRQMVDVLNATGVDWATFGNHEFDVSEAAFRAHLAQAKFRIVSSNVTDADGKPFPGVPTSAIAEIDIAGRTVRIGLIGITVDQTVKSWVRYRTAIAAARGRGREASRQNRRHRRAHALSLEQDAELVTALPGIDSCWAGTSTRNWLMYRGREFVPIVKADANVRSLAIVTLTFGYAGARPEVSARLQRIDERIALDPASTPSRANGSGAVSTAFRAEASRRRPWLRRSRAAGWPRVDRAQPLGPAHRPDRRGDGARGRAGRRRALQRRLGAHRRRRSARAVTEYD